MSLESVSPHYFQKWSHDGIICTGGSCKNVVKLTFANGASMKEKQSQNRRSLGIPPWG